MLERALKRDRAIVVAGLALVIALSWAYILAGAGMNMSDMSSMDGMGDLGDAMAMTPEWTPGYFYLILIMWWVMMLAMMLPSAAPMILLFAALNRKNAERGNPAVPTALFASGYGLAWGGFSLIAVALQLWLERLMLLTPLTPMMQSASVPLGATLLIAAGIYQLTPLKHACLRHCRAPIDYLGHHWRKGAGGALLMGLEHGTYCLGCCWVLMGLLFYGGVMNLYWIIGLAVYVLVEKLVPAGHWVGRFSGFALIGWGLLVLSSS